VHYEVHHVFARSGRGLGLRLQPPAHSHTSSHAQGPDHVVHPLPQRSGQRLRDLAGQQRRLALAGNIGRQGRDSDSSESRTADLRDGRPAEPRTRGRNKTSSARAVPPASPYGDRNTWHENQNTSTRVKWSNTSTRVRKHKCQPGVDRELVKRVH
jgi:hypothetical protein